MNLVKAISTAKPTQYESVEDSKDLRIPVQSEEAFEQGITFRCKVSSEAAAGGVVLWKVVINFYPPHSFLKILKKDRYFRCTFRRPK